MPTFEFRFRQEFAAQSPPGFRVEASQVTSREMADGRALVVAEREVQTADEIDDYAPVPVETVFATHSDRLLWWRVVPEDEAGEEKQPKTPDAPDAQQRAMTGGE